MPGDAGGKNLLALLLILLLLILLFGGLGIFVARVFLIALLVTLVIGLIAGFFGARPTRA
jgi:hypothetical protein